MQEQQEQILFPAESPMNTNDPGVHDLTQDQQQ